MDQHYISTTYVVMLSCDTQSSKVNFKDAELWRRHDFHFLFTSILNMPFDNFCSAYAPFVNQSAPTPHMDDHTYCRNYCNSLGKQQSSISKVIALC